MVGTNRFVTALMHALEKTNKPKIEVYTDRQQRVFMQQRTDVSHLLIRPDRLRSRPFALDHRREFVERQHMVVRHPVHPRAVLSTVLTSRLGSRFFSPRLLSLSNTPNFPKTCPSDRRKKPRKPYTPHIPPSTAPQPQLIDGENSVKKFIFCSLIPVKITHETVEDNDPSSQLVL
jgi:hypothetical protein